MNEPTNFPSEDTDRAAVASTLSLDLFDAAATLQLPVHAALSTPEQSEEKYVND